MNCKYCGAPISPNAKECELCGAPIENAQSQNAPNQNTDSAKIFFEEKTPNTEKGDQFDLYNEKVYAAKGKEVEKLGFFASMSVQTKIIFTAVLSIFLVILIVLGSTAWYLYAKDKKKNEELNSNTISENITDKNDTVKNNTDKNDIPKKDEIKIDIEVLSSYIDNANATDASVAVTDFKTGKRYYTKNEDDAMPASAIINIPILYTAMKKIESGDCYPDSSVTFRYMFPGRGKIGKDKNGQSYSLNELLKTMLRYSDNNATNSLINYFSPYEIEQVCSKNGFPSVSIGKYVGETNATSDNYVSAKEIAQMLFEIYNSPNDFINKNYLLQNMRIEDSASDMGMVSGVGACTFLNHNAFTSSVYNECAIVLTDTSEYAIVFLSNGGKYQDNAAVAANISSYVFNQMNK